MLVTGRHSLIIWLSTTRITVAAPSWSSKRKRDLFVDGCGWSDDVDCSSIIWLLLRSLLLFVKQSENNIGNISSGALAAETPNAEESWENTLRPPLPLFHPTPVIILRIMANPPKPIGDLTNSATMRNAICFDSFKGMPPYIIRRVSIS